MEDSLNKIRDHIATGRRAKMLLGGAVSLKSYLSVVNPELLNKIVGYTAVVEVEEPEAGNWYLYLAIPLSDGTFYKLNVDQNNFDEGDKINISSIVVVFVDTPDGKTILRCTGICPDGDASHVSQEAIREKILLSYKDLANEYENQNKHNIESKAEIRDSFKKAVKTSHNKKDHNRRSNSDYGPFPFYEDTLERNNWDVMTDGMYGDYPEEGFDGDYESIGY